MKETQGTRINKFLSEIGFCSRREADKLIEQRRVQINGKVPAVGAKISPRDKVKVDGQVVSLPEDEMIYLAFNKPVGIVCTTDTGEANNIIDYIKYPKRIFPIGRLDKPSEGLIFLTNDGDIVNKILRAKNNHEKEYLVTVDKPISPEFIRKMENGIPIMGSTTRKCKLEKQGANSFKIILTQGLNRQIRRMCEYLGYEVVKLKRIRIMNVSLDIQEGHWRDLTEQEIAEIKKMVAGSTKTQKTKSEANAQSSKQEKPASKSRSSSAGPSRPGSKKRGAPAGRKYARPAGSKRSSPSGRNRSRK